MKDSPNVPKWGDLSPQAKNLLEWSEDVFTGKRNVIYILLDEPPMLSASRSRAARLATAEPVGRQVFDEIRRFVDEAEWPGVWRLVFLEASDTHMKIASNTDGDARTS